jgi:plasmid stabilization system protein ParE
MDNRFSDAMSRLAQYPESGPAGIIAGTRELIPHQSYRIVYEQAENSIWILALVHTSRQWPPEN